jgi:hypothetical protein
LGMPMSMPVEKKFGDRGWASVFASVPPNRLLGAFGRASGDVLNLAFSSSSKNARRGVTIIHRYMGSIWESKIVSFVVWAKVTKGKHNGGDNFRVILWSLRLSVLREVCLFSRSSQSHLSDSWFLLPLEIIKTYLLMFIQECNVSPRNRDILTFAFNLMS